MFVSYVTGCQIVGETTKMEQDFKLPEYLSLEGNSSENWRRWIQRFELYLVAKEKTKKPDLTKSWSRMRETSVQLGERHA